MSNSGSLNDPGGKERILFSPLIEKALRVAATAHRNQMRKASDLPYFQHPASVVLILTRCGFRDEELLAAAALHDTIEDTDCTVESLAADFPNAVVRIVQECSEAKKDASGELIPWRVRKEAHIEIVRNASILARAIVLADKLHNLGSMLFDIEHGEELWSRFNAEPEVLMWYHREIITAASTELPTGTESEIREKTEWLAAECRRLLDVIAQSIPG